jgi:pimeloyl-ACP methyl ester carboxylesterase
VGPALGMEPVCAVAAVCTAYAAGPARPVAMPAASTAAETRRPSWSAIRSTAATTRPPVSTPHSSQARKSGVRCSSTHDQSAVPPMPTARTVRYAQEHGADSVLLYGASMGGAIVASFLERSDLAGSVRGIVLDAPMLDLAATVEHGAAHSDLPLIGGVPDVLTGTAQWIAGWRDALD